MNTIQHTEHLPVPEDAGTGLCTTAATLLWTEDTTHMICLVMQIIQHTGHLPFPGNAGTGLCLCSTINRSNLAIEKSNKLLVFLAMQIIQHTGHLPVPEQTCCGQQTQTARFV